MKIGLQIPDFTGPGAARLGADLATVARTADDAGFEFIAVMDHFFQINMVGPPEHDMLEAYTTLGYLAGCTSRAKLVTLVTGAVYRHPGILAKIVTTLDVLSGGRAELGIGAAWYEREHRGLGVAFPPTAERFERLEEALQICLQMWSDDDGPYVGAHYQLDETLCHPAPVSAPRPRILIGGGGERKTLRLVATYADACNIFGSPSELAHKIEVLRRHCDVVGRDIGEIEVTTMLRDPHPTPDEILRSAEVLADLGVATIVTSPIGDDPAAALEATYGPVVDRLAAIQPAKL